AKTFVGVWTPAPHSSLASSFARANWGIADKYLFTLTGRVDGSSKFGAGHRYGFFPSGAFAWRASDEAFVKRLGLFDDLKLRVSYGRTGNQDIGNYASLATLGSTVYVLGGARAIGFVPSSLANPDLKWETTNGIDLGADVTVLGSRVTFTADYYSKKTHDLLLDARVPSSSGFGSSVQNIGSVRNRGFELSLNSVNLTGGVVGWETSLNLAWNRNQVLNLGADSIIIDPSLLTAAGGTANQLADVAVGGPGIPAPKIGNTFESRESDLFVEDGSYLRGKNIRLSYTLPATWLETMRLQAVRRLQLYVSAQNFFTVTNYTGYDPEISEYATTNLAQGFDFGTYPQVRQITFGFSAGFYAERSPSYATDQAALGARRAGRARLRNVVRQLSGREPVRRAHPGELLQDIVRRRRGGERRLRAGQVVVLARLLVHVGHRDRRHPRRAPVRLGRSPDG